MLADFFTTNPSHPPVLTPFGHLLILMILVALLCITWNYKDSAAYACLFRGIQWLQIMALYSWYLLDGFPLGESLPLYHCRIAMFALLLLSRPSAFKDFAAYLGMGGVICALVYPIFDPFGAFHVTTFSYLVGHYALWVNALLYLCQHNRSQKLTRTAILCYTLTINACLVVVNQLTGGNYGFLAHTPLVNSNHILINFTLVSLATVGLVTIVREIDKKLSQCRKQIHLI